MARWVTIALLSTACSLPPLDHTGKACPCPSTYRCVADVCRPGVGGGTDGAVELVVLTIAADSDDATWTGSTEQLMIENGGLLLQIGKGAQMPTAGLRFSVPLPQGSQVIDARLELHLLTLTATVGSTVSVQVWNSIAVPAFANGHIHRAEGHAQGGLSAASIGGLSAVWGTTVSDNLSTLLQPLINRTEWSSGSYVGFVLTADQMPSGTWAGFEDSSHDAGTEQGDQSARLEIRFSRP